MANTIETQTIVDGSKFLVVKIHLHSDGVSGELSNVVIIDASSFTPAFTDAKLIGVHSALNGFTAELSWDATANTHLLDLPDYEYNLNGDQIGWFGGIPNKSGAGRTGDVLITTSGFTAATDGGTIILELEKG